MGLQIGQVPHQVTATITTRLISYRTNISRKPHLFGVFCCKNLENSNIVRIFAETLNPHDMIKNNFAEHNGKTVADYEVNIGKRVCKTTMKNSGEPKPFRSGHRTNTVIGVIEHPKLKVPAYVFAEDDTYVECRRCVLVNDEVKTRFRAEMLIRVSQDSSGKDRYEPNDIVRALRRGGAAIHSTGNALLILDVVHSNKIMGEIEEIKPAE